MNPVNDLSFRDYIVSGDETTAALLANGSPFVDAIEEFHSFFSRSLWVNPVSGHPLANLLGMNALMLLLAGARTALTGHPAAVFPVLRTALESASYALLVSRNQELSEIWINRHRSDGDRAKSRSAFAAPVRKAVEILNHGDDEKSAGWILDAYEASIDFGAHPNPKSVFLYTSMPKSEDGVYQTMTLTSLYGEGALETQRGLIAVLDYGLAIAVVLANSVQTQTEVVQRELEILNATKDRVARWVIDN